MLHAEVAPTAGGERTEKGDTGIVSDGSGAGAGARAGAEAGIGHGPVMSRGVISTY